MKDRKLFWGLKWVAIVLFGMIVAGKIPQISYLIEAFLDKCANSKGGGINLIIAYIIMPIIPIAILISFRLKPISLIAITITLFPLFSRLDYFGIYAYTTSYGTAYLISGIALFAPLLFSYLLFRYPINKNIRGWWLPSSKAFWLLAASGVATQFIFFPPFSAIRIAYLATVVQLLWYLIIVAYVNTIQDAYRIMWGIIIAVIIWAFLATISLSENINILIGHQSTFRKLWEAGTQYGIIMSSTLFLLPILFTRAQRQGKVLIIALALLFGEELLASKVRGAFLSLAPILAYLFILNKRKKEIIAFMLPIIIVILVFWDQILFDLTSHGQLALDWARRAAWSMGALQKLMHWPHFLVGFGIGTFENWILITEFYRPIHFVHQGFLQVWVTTGLAGFLGFCFWLGYSIWAGVKKAMKSHCFEEKLVLLGLVLTVTSWITYFMTTGGCYIGIMQEVNAIFTTEVGLLVALAQK